MDKVSRRELGRLVIGLAAAHAASPRAQAPAPTSYTGPLSGIETALDDRGFDPVAYTHGLFAAAPRRLQFRARTRREAEAWQKAPANHHRASR